MEFYHRPVLLAEVLEGLDLKDGGVYFEGTVGGGGHSFAILSSNPSVRLVGTDRDGEALEAAEKRLAPFRGRYRLFRANYKEYERVLAEAGVDMLDGVLLDLGISSHQIDDPQRGFSYRESDAPLDMRMDLSQQRSARDVVNGADFGELVRILREYGEEPFAALIAKNIVRAREKKPIETCGELEKLVEESLPPRYRSAACARQTFQAIRIEVNGELEGLGACIAGLARRLRPGGRMCVITFHSLEDRIVKEVFRELDTDCVCPKSFPVCVCGKKREAVPVNRKPITAGERELAENSRAKSAKLRIIRRI